MSDDLQARVDALEALLNRYIIKGERPMVCKYCSTIFSWLTPHEQGFAVYRYPVCMAAECRATFEEERREAAAQQRKWDEEEKARETARRAANVEPHRRRR